MRQQFSGKSSEEDGQRRWLRLGIEIHEWRLQQVPSDMLSHLTWAMGSVAQHLSSTHAVAHQEQRYRAWYHRLEERRDIIEHPGGGSSMTTLGFLGYRLS